MRLCPTAQVDLRSHEVLEFCIQQTDVGIQVERIPYRPADLRLQSQRAALGGVVGEEHERCRIARDQLERGANLLIVAPTVECGDIHCDGAIEQRRLYSGFEIPHAFGIELATIVGHDTEVEAACLVAPGKAYVARQFVGVVVAQRDISARHGLRRVSL